MVEQENKNVKKPAVENSAAGSNNKRVKNNSKTAEAPAKNKQKKSTNAPKKKPENHIAENQKKGSKKTNLKEAIIDFKEKYNLLKIGAALGIVVAIIVGIILLLCNITTVPDCVKDLEYKGRIESESVAFTMDISESQQKALSKATKVKGKKSAFDFFVDEKIVMDECDDPALIEFGSVSSNDCVLIFILYDENENVLYRSLGIEPGKQIKSIEFFEKIPYGTNKINIAVLGYDAKTYEKVGMQTAKITLEIGVE